MYVGVMCGQETLYTRVKYIHLYSCLTIPYVITKLVYASPIIKLFLFRFRVFTYGLA